MAVQSRAARYAVRRTIRHAGEQLPAAELEQRARAALGSGIRAVRALAHVNGASGGSLAGVVGSLAHKRPPVQRSVDVAVPLRVAWREWMALHTLPEGVDQVSRIRRDGDGRLRGRIGQRRWEAAILDERPEESFAWQSSRGSDCAGLVTFHQLSERLTRLELSLDVMPQTAAEALLLSTRVADRRAENDLRRFKARLELISPDTYDDYSDQPDDPGDQPGDEGEQ